MSSRPSSSLEPSTAPASAPEEAAGVGAVDAAPAVAPRPSGLRARLSGSVERVQGFRKRHETAELAGFFAAGFLFDVVTMGRVDDLATLLSQAGYLVTLGLLLLLEQRHAAGGGLPNWLTKGMRYSEEAIHFLLGSLLSLSSLFYFKSASGLAALAFLILMFGALVANELPALRRKGPVVRFGLFSFCLTSYFAYAIPVVAGFMSPWLFVGAASLSLLCGYGLYRLVARWSSSAWAVRRQVLLPFALVQLLLVGLLFSRAVPPVPLAVEHLGIYHSVERTEEGYELEHERPSWRFWHTGDQRFLAREGDRVYVFARIFAPRHFTDQVNLRWLRHHETRGWLQTDLIPLKVVGGRADGYRGYAYKSNYVPGEWRVDVETLDGRVIGRIDFTIEPDPRVPVHAADAQATSEPGAVNPPGADGEVAGEAEIQAGPPDGGPAREGTEGHAPPIPERKFHTVAG